MLHCKGPLPVDPGRGSSQILASILSGTDYFLGSNSKVASAFALTAESLNQSEK